MKKTKKTLHKFTVPFIVFLVFVSVVFYAQKTLVPKSTPDRKCINLLIDGNMQVNIQKMLSEIKKGEAQLFDVREKFEWNAGHLKIASFVPLSGLSRNTVSLDSYDKNKTTYIHCRSGNRVLRAGPILIDNGFKKVVCLQYGYQLLKKAGLDTVK